MNSQPLVTEKRLRLFLKFLYTWHKAEYGDSIAALSKGGIHALDCTFPNEIPAVAKTLNIKQKQELTALLAEELQARHLASYESMIVTLTPKGYKKAYAIKHPIRHFLKSKWQWLITIGTRPM